MFVLCDDGFLFTVRVSRFTCVETQSETLAMDYDSKRAETGGIASSFESRLRICESEHSIS